MCRGRRQEAGSESYHLPLRVLLLKQEETCVARALIRPGSAPTERIRIRMHELQSFCHLAGQYVR